MPRLQPWVPRLQPVLPRPPPLPVQVSASPHRAVQQLVRAADEEFHSSDNISVVYVHL